MLIVTLTAALLFVPAAPPAAGPIAGKSSFPARKAAVVKAYAMNSAEGRVECRMPFEDGKRCSAVTVEKTLTPAQAKKVHQWLNARSTYGGAEAKCFLPHHGFAFFDADGALIDQVSVCFMCGNMRTSSPIRVQPDDPSRSAFSRKGLKTLRSLCKELKLPMCDTEKR